MVGWIEVCCEVFWWILLFLLFCDFLGYLNKRHKKYRQSRAYEKVTKICFKIYLRLQVVKRIKKKHYLLVTKASHNIESLRMSGEEQFYFQETWRPDWDWNARSPTFQAGSFNHRTRAPPFFWSWKFSEKSGIFVFEILWQSRICQCDQRCADFSDLPFQIYLFHVDTESGWVSPPPIAASWIR